MAKVLPGRYTGRIEGPFVVFIIGMRVNKLWAIHKWLPVAKAMGPMITELNRKPELGFLGSESFISWRGVNLVQYWRSYEQLEKYARGGIHLEAWGKFNQTIGTDGTVGIYHETFIIQENQYECLYNNMPRFGLGRVAQHIPAVGPMETARRRLGETNEPAVPSPPNPIDKI